jgi:hypothetical protein
MMMRNDIKEILSRVFGDLTSCHMEYYSEVEGEVFQSVPQFCGTLTYFYVFAVELDEESSDNFFVVDLWHNCSGQLMSPRLDSLAGVYRTEEEARNIKSEITQNIERSLKCD